RHDRGGRVPGDIADTPRPGRAEAPARAAIAHVMADRGGQQTGEQDGIGHPSKITPASVPRSEEHTSELQSRFDLVCRLLLEKKNTVDNPLFRQLLRRIKNDSFQLLFVYMNHKNRRIPRLK